MGASVGRSALAFITAMVCLWLLALLLVYFKSFFYEWF